MISQQFAIAILVAAVRVVPIVLTAVGLFLSIVPTASAQRAVTPQQPSVPWEAFRVDSATGALTPLESTKAKKETRGGRVFCYVERDQSSMTIRSDEQLVFVFRYDGSPKNAETLRNSRRAWYKGLEFVFVSDNARRYATGKFVPVDIEPYGEVVSGVNPKNQKEVGQSFVIKPQGPLAPGEYALTLGGMAAGSYPDPGCTQLAVSAFRIVDAPIATRPTPSTPAARQATPQETMIDTIIRMVAAKVPDDVIINIIRNSGAKFDLNPDALIRLKTAGVSDAVLRAMIQ